MFTLEFLAYCIIMLIGITFLALFFIHDWEETKASLKKDDDEIDNFDFWIDD